MIASRVGVPAHGSTAGVRRASLRHSRRTYNTLRTPEPRHSYRKDWQSFKVLSRQFAPKSPNIALHPSIMPLASSCIVGICRLQAATMASTAVRPAMYRPCPTGCDNASQDNDARVTKVGLQGGASHCEKKAGRK
jgi:hypothetical protein